MEKVKNIINEMITDSIYICMGIIVGGILRRLII